MSCHSCKSVGWVCHHEAAVTADPTVPPHMAYMLGVDYGSEPSIGALTTMAHCPRCKTTRMVQFGVPLTCACPAGPLDAVIDGVTLRELLEIDEERRREAPPSYRTVWSQLSPAQRAAVSAHWSADLRARVEATAKPKLTVMVDLDCDD